MQNFFRTHDGHLRGLRVCACLYVFNTILTLVSDGWRSISWISGLLMAFGFFAISQVAEGPKSERPKCHSPTYLVGVAASVLGLSTALFDLLTH